MVEAPELYDGDTCGRTPITTAVVDGTLRSI